uniref:Uncharacterized protein n=1 Tax=Tetradesmus obliquus TaxID=3088 RepID=A0A383VSM1_TETOB|eukprot:jgi/Sobl393_1/14511/SZX68181.1
MLLRTSRDQHLPSACNTTTSSNNSSSKHNVSSKDASTQQSIPTKDPAAATCDVNDVINVGADASVTHTASTADAAAAAADAHVMTVQELQQQLQGSSCKLQRSGSSIYDLHSKKRRYLYLCISALASTLVPLCDTIYLPALRSLQADFATSESMVNASIAGEQ